MPYKKYEQPYSSRHVRRNTIDSIRADDPIYIKNFPRFVNSIYRKQTPFDLNVLPHIRTTNQTIEGSETISGKRRKTSSARSPATGESSGKQATGAHHHQNHQQRREQQLEQQQPQQRQQEQQQQQAANFKTLAPSKTTKSPSMAISAIPSDFEHIFHYSETQ